MTTKACMHAHAKACMQLVGSFFDRRNIVLKPMCTKEKRHTLPLRIQAGRPCLVQYGFGKEVSEGGEYVEVVNMAAKRLGGKGRRQEE